MLGLVVWAWGCGGGCEAVGGLCIPGIGGFTVGVKVGLVQCNGEARSAVCASSLEGQ